MTYQLTLVARQVPTVGYNKVVTFRKNLDQEDILFDEEYTQADIDHWKDRDLCFLDARNPTDLDKLLLIDPEQSRQMSWEAFETLMERVLSLVDEVERDAYLHLCVHENDIVTLNHFNSSYRGSHDSIETYIWEFYRDNYSMPQDLENRLEYNKIWKDWFDHFLLGDTYFFRQY